MYFAEILGQQKAVKLLNRALETGRLAHAYLFHGPDGVGKTTTAQAMAAILFCQENGAARPCGYCKGCIKYDSDNHPDFLHIKPQGAVIKIDQVRELKKSLRFSPLVSEYRVILIEDVHTMRREACNSLLKLLEEPPPGNLLLLSADETEQLLPTLISRCQVIPFYPLPVDLAAEILMKTDPALEKDGALTLAAMAGGCPGHAISFDTEGLLLLRKEIIETLLAKQDNQAHQTETALILAARAAELKDGIESLLELLRIFFKETMVSLLCSSTIPSRHPELDQEINRSRERWNLEQLSDMVHAVDYAEKALARNCGKTLVCEVLFFKLMDSN